MSYQPNFIKKIFHKSRRCIAKNWLLHMPVLQIAVTGSQGKTNTTNVIYHLLKTIGPTACTDINLDTTYNVPITALTVTPWTRFALFELGVDHPFEMNSHLEIVRPNIGVITGISPVHTDKEHFGSLENLILEKRKLIETLPSDGYAILNGDDEYVRKMAPFTKANIIFYGRNSTNDIYASDINVSLNGTFFTLNIKKTIDSDVRENQIPISTQLIGPYHIYTIMSSLITLIAVQKITHIHDFIYKYIKTIESIRPLKGRMSVENGPMNTTLLDDSLRANPTSTSSGLTTLSAIHHKNQKIAVLAEMGELQEPEKEHKKIGELLAHLAIDRVVLIGSLHKYTREKAIQNGFNTQSILWTENVLEAANILKTIIHQGDLIYLKGSLLRHIERVPMILNGEKVKCKTGLCPFYHHCSKCEYKEFGYFLKN